MIFALLLLSTDFTGIWVGKVPARNGEMQDIAFQFKQAGSRLAGKLYGDYQSSRIVQGTVAGEVVTFVVSGTEQAGNQINEARTRFTGRVYENGELELTRERESSRNTGNGGAAEEKQKPPRQTFRLKRLT